MKTVLNVSRLTVSFLSHQYRVQIAPGKYGELPDGIADKYEQRGAVEIIDTDKAPPKPTPKRSRPSKSEELV